MIFTHFEVEVLKLYQGNVQEYKTITVFITGGTMGDIETIPFRESPLLEMGSEYLFLLRYSNDVDYDYYFPAGGYQGVFLIKDDTLCVIGERNDAIAEELDGMKVASIENMMVEMCISITQNDDLEMSTSEEDTQNGDLESDVSEMETQNGDLE